MLMQAIRTIIEQWHPPRDRVLWAPVCLGAGIALYFTLAHEPSFIVTSAALLVATALLIIAYKRSYLLVFPAVALFLGVLGFTLAQGRSMVVYAPMLDRQINFTRVEGRVIDISVLDDDADAGKRRVTLGDLNIEKLPPYRTPATIRLSSSHLPADIRPGARIAITARLMPPSGPVAPEGFDYRRQAYFDQMGAVGFTLGKFERLGGTPDTRDLWFNTLRQTISRHIATNMTHPESAVATALLAGERASIPDTVNQDLLDSGLYHLLSISGLHVAIVCGVVFFTLRFGMALWPWLALHWPIKKIAAVAALGAGLFYTLLAGAPVPTQRSMLTTGLVLLAVMLDRAAISLRTLALAAFFVLAFRPESLVGASFQLSFAAVVSMIAFHEAFGRRLMIDGREASPPMKAIGYVWGIVVTTVLVGFATLPIVLHHFGRLQLLGVVANALAIPLTSFVVMPAGMAAMLLMPFGLDAPFLKITAWGVTATLDVAHWVANLPHAVIAAPSLPLVPYLFSASGFLLLILWRGWFRWVGAGVMVVAVAIGFMQPRPVAMLDGEGRVLAVAGGGQIAYISKTPTKFMRKNWVSLWGGTEANDGKPIGNTVWQAGGVEVACDAMACRISKGGAHLSVLNDRTVLPEECIWAQTIVALDKGVKADTPCGEHALIMPYWDIRAAGGIAFYAAGAGWHTAPFLPQFETRPWSVKMGSVKMGSVVLAVKP